MSSSSFGVYCSSDWRAVMFSAGKKSEIGQRLGIQYTKAMQPSVLVSFGDITMEFHQESMGLMAISGVVWDAGLLMVDFLLWAKAQNEFDALSGRLLDIGCGTGIAGVSVLLLNDSNNVLFTDIDKLPCFDYNIDQLSETQRQRQEFVTYRWSETNLPESFQFSASSTSSNLVSGSEEREGIVWDTLLCSDLLYEEKCHALLLSVLRRIAFKRAIFTYKQRHEVPEEKFFEALSQWCTVRVVNRETIPLVNLPSTSMSGLFVVIVEPIVAL
eukprot:gene31381-35423_t